MGKLADTVAAFKREIQVYYGVLRDPRTPLAAKIILGAALAYLASPIDLIPDFIPILGQLDDLLIVPGLVALALWIIPREIVREHREKVAANSTHPA